MIELAPSNNKYNNNSYNNNNNNNNNDNDDDGDSDDDDDDDDDDDKHSTLDAGTSKYNIVLIKRLNKSIFIVLYICCKGVNKHNADVINIKDRHQPIK